MCSLALLTCSSIPLQSGAMGGKPLNTFYTQLVLMPQVLHYAQYVLLGLGGLLLLVPIIYQLRSQVSRRGGRTLSGRVSLLPRALILAPPANCCDSSLPVLEGPGPSPVGAGLREVPSHLTSEWVPLDSSSVELPTGGGGGRQGLAWSERKWKTGSTKKTIYPR